MRHFLISVVLLGLAAGCSSVNIGPHRIDVQQGNALDQDNIARLKPGLSRSQVRFLLGTPLLVDPFHSDRWDYVYLYYKAGKLAEQKRITLFFEGETLARMEGDLPAAAPAVQPGPKAETAAVPPGAQAQPTAVPQSAPAIAVAAPAAVAVTAPSSPAAQAPTSATSMMPPMAGPKSGPAQVAPHASAELRLQPETDVAKIQPDVTPPFPGTERMAAANDAAVLKSLNEWAAAWARRDSAAYFATYDDRFVPQGGGSRGDWEKRKRQALSAAKRIEIKIDSPSVERTADGAATVTFKQFYRSDRYRDAVLKQLRMVEHEGRWLIAEEKVLSPLSGAQP